MNLFIKQKKKTPSKSITLEELAEEVEMLRERVQELSERMETSVSKVGMIRYNPFDDIGGDQSFSIALLDCQDNGFVVTSHHYRDVTRVYAKDIAHGNARHVLSGEEIQVLQDTMLQQSKSQVSGGDRGADEIPIKK